ncbi:MAG: DUF1512 family protein [Candidatus Hodarchaeaceae archaeon]|nr:DUF1512 family protein [Candidatus Hodarchaeaceae archaeon]
MPLFDISLESILVWIVVLLLLGFVWSYFTPYLLTFQSRLVIGQVRKSVNELEKWAKEGRRIALSTITKYGRPKRDIEKDFDNFLEFFTIEPVSDDPAGVIQRLEHVLDVRKKRFEGAVARFAPNADEETAANLEMTIEGAMASYWIFRVVRHFMLLAEKTKSYQLIMILQMQMPILKEYAKAYLDATKTFADGKPIGDGVGAMVAAKLMDNASCKELAEDTVYAETKFDGRKLIVVKAKGPGGRVGKPGELIARLIKRRKVDRIIMIDAGLKLEGEASGHVIEGVGAAIGGPPTEKYKIEEVAVKHGIPVDAIIIKESFKEAITPLNKRLARAVDFTTERVKQAMRERTKRGDVVVVAGIGNTIGIGQGPDQLPREFPEPTEEKGIESDKLLFR